MTRLPILRAALTLIFLYYGGRKLIGHPLDVAIYDAIGMGQWPRPITGTVEVLSAIGLWIPGVQGFAALLLIATMITGTLALIIFTDMAFYHLIMLGLAAATVAYAFREQFRRR